MPARDPRTGRFVGRKKRKYRSKRNPSSLPWRAYEEQGYKFWELIVNIPRTTCGTQPLTALLVSQEADGGYDLTAFYGPNGVLKGHFADWGNADTEAAKLLARAQPKKNPQQQRKTRSKRNPGKGPCFTQSQALDFIRFIREIQDELNYIDMSTESRKELHQQLNLLGYYFKDPSKLK